MMTVLDILEELEGTSGRNAKRSVLEDHRTNKLLKRVLVAALDPYTVYYINKFKMPKPVADSDSEDVTLSTFLDIIAERLATRQVTGNDAKKLVNHMFSKMTKREQKWCQRIILKNLRVGAQESTVNDVWGDLVKSFSVALAQTLKSEFTPGEGIKILDKVNYPVRVEPKLDGLRCIAIKRDGEVTFYTRNGTVLETLPRIKAALEAADYDDFVLDGEAMGEDWNESASVLMSPKNTKDDSNIFYNVFDAMPLDAWVAQDPAMTDEYGQRCKAVAEVVKAAKSKHVRQVPHIMAKNEAELKRYFAKCMDEGYEGVMLKTLDTPYEWKRTKNIVKLKPFVTYEGVVVDHYEGRHGTKREGQFGGFEVLLPNGVITKVGGGFNDAERAGIQLEGAGAWIGRILECKAQPDPLTTDGLTVDGKMRFPVYMRTRDKSDVDPKVMKAFRAWAKAN